MQVIREAEAQWNTDNITDGDYFERLEREEQKQEELKQETSLQRESPDLFVKVQQESLRGLEEF